MTSPETGRELSAAVKFEFSKTMKMDINSTKDKDESVLCVVVVNRALHSEVQSSPIQCAM